MAFTEKLDDAGLKFFNEVCAKPFDQQAMAFLNAYWTEVGSQCEFIFEVAFDVIQYADMHAKGVQYIHLYDMGNELDFNIGLFFYEQLCKRLQDPRYKKWTGDEYAISQPEMLTAIKRKTELRDKVDVNFDNKITMLEYLLYQYKDVANPGDFVTRSMSGPEEHPEITKARLALEDVNKRIKEYEAEKMRLMMAAYVDGDESKGKNSGVKAMRAINQLAQLDSSPLKETLNCALIKAEAALRKANKMFKDAGGGGAGAEEAAPSAGSMWWMNFDLAQKQKKYGKKK